MTTDRAGGRARRGIHRRRVLEEISDGAREFLVAHRCGRAQDTIAETANDLFVAIVMAGRNELPDARRAGRKSARRTSFFSSCSVLLSCPCRWLCREHDLRATASRLSQGKPVPTLRSRRPCVGIMLVVTPPKNRKTPPAFEDTDGVFHALTPFEAAALDRTTAQSAIRSQKYARSLRIFNA